jgi:hypothetical protein
MVRPADRLGLVTAYLPWRNAASLLEPAVPMDRRADRDPIMLGYLIARHRPLSTADTTRSRRCFEYGRPINAGLHLQPAS